MCAKRCTVLRGKDGIKWSHKKLDERLGVGTQSFGSRMFSSPKAGMEHCPCPAKWGQSSTRKTALGWVQTLLTLHGFEATTLPTPDWQRNPMKEKKCVSPSPCQDGEIFYRLSSFPSPVATVAGGPKAVVVVD